MTLWWLQPGWTETRCSCCGALIYPEGDPDWGLCWPCMNRQQEEHENERRAQETREMEEHFRRHPHG